MRFYSFLFLLALIVSGCAESDIEISDIQKADLAELSIVSLYKGEGIELNSNSIDSDYLPDGSEMGVFVHNLSSAKCVPNLKWRALGSSISQYWINIGEDGLEKVHYLNGQYSRLFTYYPFTDNATDLLFEHTDSYLQDYLPALRVKPGQTDYMVGAGKSLVNSQFPSTAIIKKHMMSFLTFQVEKKAGYQGSGIITELIIKNQVMDAWVSLNRGVYIPQKDRIQLLGDVYVPVHDQKNMTVLVIPQSSDVLADSYFQINIDGKEHKVVIPDNDYDRYIWEPGKRYVYKFKLNPTGDITAEVSDFQPGGDWDAIFKNPKIIVNPEGNMDELSRPTPYWDDNAQSRKFEVAKADLSGVMSWYEGASWIRHGGSISGLTPGKTGCQTYRENGEDWRIPTYYELQYIYKLKTQDKLPKNDFEPVSGRYWSGNWIQNKNHATYWDLSVGASGDASPSVLYKIRCVRDI